MSRTRVVLTLREEDYSSSSWLQSTPMLGRENEINYYRTDPVKYDLKIRMPLKP